MPSQLKLYTCEFSPPCRAVRFAGNLLGVNFHDVVVDLCNGAQRKPEYLKINPQHTVPVLDDNGFILSDSHAILPYLVDKYGKDDSLYPKDLQQRALIDQRMHFIGGVFFPACKAIVRPIFRKYTNSISAVGLEQLEEVYGFLDAFLAKSPFLAGDHLTIADISGIAEYASSEIFVPVDPERFPNLVAWSKRIKKLPFYDEDGLAFVHKLNEGVKIEKPSN